MLLKLYNTLTSSVEEFIPQDPRAVSLFVCGPTVYGPMHLGHARTYIFFDLLSRFLRHLGYNVRYIQNVTDVGHLSDEADQGEDKILREAVKQGRDPKGLADFFFEEHKTDMLSLGNLPPEYHRATDYIPQMIQFVQGLIDKGFAYEKEGYVYFSLDKFPKYGELSGKRKEELISGVRVEKDPRKENPLDFALWLKAPQSFTSNRGEGERRAPTDYPFAWDSPWGKGFPGWHLEDSAIIKELFGGKTIDIHGGAIELSFPHHENEIAQFEALTDEKQARFWLHTGLVLINGEKMSKSKENFVTVKELLEKFPKQAVRLWVMQSHFRSPIDYTEKELFRAEELWKKIRRVVFIAAGEGKIVPEYKEKLETDLAENLNTPQFLTDLHEMLDRKDLSSADIKATVHYFDDVLGLGAKELITVLPGDVELLIEKREAARQSGNFDLADIIRSELLEKGWQVDDTSEGPKAYPK